MTSIIEKIILTSGTIGILGMFGSPMINNKEVRDRVYEAGKIVTIATGIFILGYYSGMKENKGGKN